MPAITIRTVSCSACTTSFPVDPAKVPPGGVRARCSVCGAIFRVEGTDGSAPDGPSAPPEATADRVGVASFPDAGPDPDSGPEPWSGVPDDPAEPHGEAVAVEEPGEGAAPEWDEHPTLDRTDEPAAAEGVVDEPSLGWFPEAPADGDESAAEPAEPTAPREPRDEAPSEPTAPWEPTDEAPSEPTSPWEPQDDARPEPAAPWEPAGEAPPEPAVPWEAQEEPAAETPAEPEAKFEGLDELDEIERAEARGRDEAIDADAAVEDEIFTVDDLPAAADDAPPAEEGGDEDPFAGTAVEDYATPVSSTPPEEVVPLPQGFQFGRRDPHEKARRLARVLVSDIITYNPERYLRALENDSLREDFDEEIGKSWTEYVEQVGPEIANETDYWKSALNDLLARGRDVF